MIVDLPLILAAVAVGVDAEMSYKVKESVHAHPSLSGWTKLHPAPPDHTIHLRIGLKQGGIEDIRAHLEMSSDPFHALYGSHLTAEEVDRLSAPTGASLDGVYEWLATHGINFDECRHSSSKDWVKISLPAHRVEKLLDTKYHVYQHSETDEQIVRTESYSLPEHLHEHIDLVAPTTYFSSLRRVAKLNLFHAASSGLRVTEFDSGSVSKVCNTSLVTSECLRTFYGTIDYKPKVPERGHVGVTGYLGETAIRSDLQLFLEDQRPDAARVNATFELEKVNGGQNPQKLNQTQIAGGTGMEAGLDVQTVFGVAFPIPVTFYTTGGSPPFKPDVNTPRNNNEPYLDWLDFIFDQPASKLSNVITTSYNDDEQTVPPAYARRVCDDFMRLGVRGVSLLFGSGDSGVGNPGKCVSNDGKNRTVFLAEFPASCPYVTTVGATMNFNPEIAANDTTDFSEPFFSGGGFSNYFTAPSYQAATVAKYIKSLDGEHHGLFNPNGRGYPDVAAQGSKFKIRWQGANAFIPESGVSAATPLFSSIVALLNDVRLADGKSTLGFLNPWIYSKGKEGLMDITSGASQGCNKTGFPAQKGWDAVTGFGTPDFKLLEKLVV